MIFGVLLFHSFGSSNLEFLELNEYLEEQGFRTSTPLLPGHGTFPEDLKNYTYRDWFQASEKALTNLDCKVTFLVGQITGAPLGLLLASKHPEVLGIVTLSGIISLPKFYKFFRNLLNLKPTMVSWGVPDSKSLLISKTILEKKMRFYQKVPKKSLNETFNLIQQARIVIHKVKQPIYILHSSLAKEISPKNATFIFNKVSSKKKKLMLIEKGSPLMSMGIAKHIVFREVTNFLWSCIDLYQM